MTKGTEPKDSQAEWSVPKPETIPSATYTPAATALGLTLLFWGLITSPVLLLAGLGVTAWGLSTWIGEIRRGA